jgi:hypothetical protein
MNDIYDDHGPGDHDEDDYEDDYEDEREDDYDDDYDDRDLDVFDHACEDEPELNVDSVGLALAFGETISDNDNKYDLDENTDEENMREASKYFGTQKVESNLRPFEEYVQQMLRTKRNTK